jgi:hypothetical protein
MDGLCLEKLIFQGLKKPMSKKLSFVLANIIFSIHLLYGVFLIFGWLVPQAKVMYITCLLLWIGSWVVLGYCPLSRWEFVLRKSYDESIDDSTEIIQFYLYKFFGKEISSEIIFCIGIGVFCVLFYLGLRN